MTTLFSLLHVLVAINASPSTGSCPVAVPPGVLKALVEAFPEMPAKSDNVFCPRGQTDYELEPGYHFVDSEGWDPKSTSHINVVVQSKSTKFVTLFPKDPTSWGLSVGKECADKLPTDLSKGLKRVLDGTWVLPHLKDLGWGPLFADLENRGDGCVAVTTGDYNGDNRPDFAAIVKSTEQHRPSLAVVALTLPKGWKFFFLTEMDLSRDFIKTVGPGSYEHTQSFDPNPLSLAEAESFIIKTDGVGLGTYESSETIYAFLNGTWRWVAVSN